GDLPGAAASFRRAVKINPNHAAYHGNLGDVLDRQGDLPAAAASFRQAIKINPDLAMAHCALGQVLLRQGDPTPALERFQTGHDRGTSQEEWPHPSAMWVKQCKRLIKLNARLPAILKGEDKPADAAERLELAELCHYKGLHVSSAQLYTETFDADAKS